MQFILVLTGLFATLAAAGDVHPVVGVIDLLKNLQDQVKTEGLAEEVTYNSFVKWCVSSEKTLNEAIVTATEQIEVLKDTIKAKQAEEILLTKQIAKLGDEIAKFQAAAIKAEEDRNAALALYTQADSDLADTVTAIEDAITEMKSAEDTTKPASMLLHKKVVKLLQLPLLLEQLTDSQRETLMAIKDTPASKNGAAAKPAAAAKPSYDDLFAKGNFQDHTEAYDFKSGNVIELLKTLNEKFENDRVEGTKAETAAANNYALAKDARDNAEAAAEEAKEAKTTQLGEVQADLATAISDLTGTQQTLADDSQNLKDTQQSCSMKKSEWAERTETREMELEAMAQAIVILGKVTGVSTETPTNPVPPPSPLAFAQGNLSLPKLSTITMVQAVHKAANPKQRAVNLLRQEAEATHSRKLAQFAEEVAKNMDGPFDVVNNMIQKMIFRLMAEQTDEDEHKNWCDLEMSKTNTSEFNKKAKVAELELKIEADKAKADQLGNEVTVALDMVTTLEEHIAEATEIRKTGKEQNAAAIKDATDAQKAIAQATAVIEKFYKDSGMMKKEAWEFVQQAPAPVTLPEDPSTWDASYTGVADPEAPGDGVVALLKAVAADFSKMEADTEAQEQMDQNNYNEEMKSCKIEKARSAKEAEMKGDEQKRTLDNVKVMEKSLKTVSNQLAAVMQYWKDLSPACIEGDSTYEERKAARAAEESALKEAQVILADAFKENASPAAAPAAFLAPVKRT